MVKKFVASGLSLMLAVSMAFAAAPAAYANSLSSIENLSSALSVQVSASADSTPEGTNDSSSGGASTGGANTDETQNAMAPSFGSSLWDWDTPALPADNSTDNSTDNPVDTPQGNQTDGLSTSNTSNTHTETAAENGAQSDALDTRSNNSLLGKVKALYELNRALDTLYRTIWYATGPTVIRADSGPLTEEDPSAVFQEGVYYSNTATLVNSINNLLKECGLPSGLYVSSLPITVVGELPKGFSFSNNTLTLTDQSLLSWNAELGDKPESTTRSYSIKLQLNTGVAYIDTWLMLQGVLGLSADTFTVELQLINLPDLGVVDPGNPGNNGGDPENPSNPGGEIEQPVDPGNNGGDTGGSVENGGEANSPVIPDVASTTVVITTIIEATSDDTSATPENSSPDPQSSPTQNQVTTIEDPEIPMASMLIDDNGNLIVVNAGLASLSLLLSGVSLVSLRQRRPSGAQLFAAAQPQMLALGFGAVSMALGAFSAIVLVISQYLTNTTLGESISWTSVLVIISSIQAVCTLGLFLSTRLTKKPLGKPRYKIRY